MSVKLISAAYDVEDLPPTERAVLVRLAWHADEHGLAWPPINGPTGLVTKTGFKERAVQMAIKALCAEKHITRTERRGCGVEYKVHPRTTCTPQNDNQGTGDVVTPAATPAPDAPRTTCAPAPHAPTPAPHAPKETLTDRHTDGRVGAGSRGRRIDLDWQPDKPLPADLAAAIGGWPVARVETELIEFRDFWLADAGKRATKLDWDRTWWNRLRELVKRDERGPRYRGKRPDETGGRYRDPLLNALARESAAGVD